MLLEEKCKGEYVSINMPLCLVDCFEPKAIKTQKIQKNLLA